MRNFKRRILATGVAALTALSLGACSLLPQEEARRVTPVARQTEAEEFSFTYAIRGDMELYKRISCTYVPIQKENLYFQVAGEYVDEITVKAGDSVAAGQVLGQLKMDGVEERIAECQLEIDLLQLKIEHLEQNRALALKKQEILYEDDEEALRKAQKSVNDSYDESRRTLEDSLDIQNLELTTIQDARRARQLVSPIDGTVTYARTYSESSVSSLTERAVTIADSTLSLFSANTEYWDALNAGDTVTITARKVEYEAVVADETALGLPPVKKTPGEKATVYFTLTTPALELEDNDKGTFNLVLDSRTDVLKVDEHAVSTAAGQTIVYYQNEEGMKAYKPVELGLNAEGYYEVLSGLDEGEAVIVDER